MREICDLREDPDRISAIRKAAFGSSRFGLILDECTFRDDSWWQNLEIHTIDGTIEGFDYGPMGDWRTFRIRTSLGTVTDWITCELRSGQPDIYRIGARVRWRYIDVVLKTPVAGLPPSHPLTLEIWISDQEETAPR